MLQEEQSCTQSEVVRLRSDLEAREAELREARAEVTSSRQRLMVSEAEERLTRSSSDSSLLGVYTVDLESGPRQPRPEIEVSKEAEGSTGAVAGKEEKTERTVPKITFTMGREE